VCDVWQGVNAASQELVKSERVVVFERATGKLVTGPNAPTESGLLSWIRRHPTFEVVQPRNSVDLSESLALYSYLLSEYLIVFTVVQRAQYPF
jgi:hypothetical protein